MESQNLETTDFKPGDIVTWDLDKPDGVRWYQRHGFGPFDVTRVDDTYVYLKYKPDGGDGGFYPFSLMKILEEAVLAGLDEFLFIPERQPYQFVTAYAKYLIEYLEDVLVGGPINLRTPTGRRDQ